MDQSVPAVPPVEHENARLEIDSGSGHFRDEHGRQVVLRGINAGGRSKWAPFLPFPVPESPSPEQVRERAIPFFESAADWGLDTLRLPFSWEAVEPVRGAYDEAYLDRYRAMLDAAWTHDMRVIVDFHQDVYASPFCGDGFPLWTLTDDELGPPCRDDALWFLRYTMDGRVQRAFQRFWDNVDGVRDAFEAMWTHLGERLGDHPSVVAFELINEPGWGESVDVERWKRDVLMPFYAEMERVVHQVVPDVLVCYDPPGIDALYPIEVERHRPEGEGFIYGPHYYDNGLVNGLPWAGSNPEPVAEILADFRAQHATPVLIGEFGYHHGAKGAEQWLERVVDALDQYHLSGTLWEYSITDEFWNAEDLSVVDPDGSERSILEIYARPWLRALSGTHADFRWDPARQHAWAEWLADGGVTEIAIPTRTFDSEPVNLEIQGRNAAYTWDTERRELRVQAPAGSLVTVQFGAKR